RTDSAMTHARSAVHQVLTGLEADDWAVLVLSEIDRLSADELAAFLDSSAEDLTARLQELHADVHEHLLAEATPSMRVSLLESLPEDWLRIALGDILRELPEPADGLRARIAAGAGPQTNAVRAVPEPPSAQKTVTPDQEPRSKRRTFRPASILIGIALILVVGFGADYLHSLLSREPEPDLIVLAARSAERFTFDLETTSVDRAERFLHTHSGLRPVIPRIEGAALTGVGMEEVSTAVHAPAIRYVDDESGLPITIYAISYRFLDDNPSVRLSPDVRRQIQSETNFDLHSLGSDDVLVWRHRSNIYLAVTDLDGRDLETRISIP
ncbi:MAG: hypothetical protein R3178_08935, partial [Rhodothermales bacterium]|nr:hypothetical protein [Rhodothermales bacterium]